MPTLFLEMNKIGTINLLISGANGYLNVVEADSSKYDALVIGVSERNRNGRHPGQDNSHLVGNRCTLVCLDGVFKNKYINTSIGVITIIDTDAGRKAGPACDPERCLSERSCTPVLPRYPGESDRKEISTYPITMSSNRIQTIYRSTITVISPHTATAHNQSQNSLFPCRPARTHFASARILRLLETLYQASLCAATGMHTEDGDQQKGR